MANERTSAARRLQRWLAERTRATTDALARQGAPGWSRTLGTMLLALIALELLTGLAMAFFYSPSVTDAWASIAYLETEVRLGSFVRALHHWGNDALVVVAVLHLATTFVIGAYRKPRELTWLTGLVMLLLVVAFTLTGIVLPFDARSLAASQVETQIIHSMPLIGPLQRELLIGGNDYGNLSLTRFYALHALVLPVALGGLVAAHVALVRRHGPAPRWWQHDTAGEASGPPASARRPWWPFQAARDAVAVLAVVGLVMVAAWVSRAPLYAPADPSGSFDARPAWYFMPLFELRKTFTGAGEIVATAVLPALALAFLALVPFLDRDGSGSPLRRKRYVLPFVAGLLGVVALGALGVMADAGNTQHQEALADARKEGAEALRLAAMGGVPLDPLRLIENDRPRWGEQLFAEHCASCHGVGTGLGCGPDLGAWGSAAWLERFLDDPNHRHLYGGTALAGKMLGIEAYGIEDADDRAALVAGLVARRGEGWVPQGVAGAETDARFVEVFDDAGCQACHRLELGEQALGRVDAMGPELTYYGSPQWVETLLLSPDAPSHYGKLNTMPSFAAKLDRAEREALTEYLMTLADSTPLAREPTEIERLSADPGCVSAVAAAQSASSSSAARSGREPSSSGRSEAAAPAAGSWEAGRALFEKRCASCHTVGESFGTDVGPDLAGWGSRGWLLAFLAAPDHAALYGGTPFEGKMPSAADLGLDDAEELDLLVSALLARRDGVSPALEAAIGPRARGIFTEYGCGACHDFEIGGEHVGNVEASGPTLTGWGSAAWLHGLLEEPDSELYYGEDNAMPPFDGLSEAERAGLTRYVMSLSEAPMRRELEASGAALLEP